MRARSLIGLAVALVALLAVTGPAPGAQAASKPCAARRSTTVARNAQVRVYERGSDDHVLVGCLLSSGRRLTLDSWFSCGCSRGDESAPQAWLRGTVVAVNRYSCDPIDPLGGCSGSARTVDVRTRRTLRSASTGGSVGELLIGPHGAIALVAGRGLVAADADGERVLDPGPGIAHGSLAFAGPLLYWTSGGAPRSAQLRP